MKKLHVGIFIFDAVEVLDFAGPYEVFSRTRTIPGVQARRTEDSAPFRVFTVAANAEAVVATGGLRVLPDFSFESAPHIDLLVVPGGFGTRELLDDIPTHDWIRRVAGEAKTVASVCTGALLLARAGLLANRRATTHWASLDRLASLDPTIIVKRDRRYVSDGIVTSAGVAAGLDMAFAIVESLCGKVVADETARYLEYSRASD